MVNSPTNNKIKKDFKIRKGYLKMTDFLSQKIYVRFPNLHMDLQSLNSMYSLSLMKIAKRGIQRTPSMYDEEDIWEYLLDNYTLKELSVIKSSSRMKFILDRSIILSYAIKITENSELKKDLKMLYNCVKLKENIDQLEEFLSSTVDNTLPRTVSPTAYVRQGHILYRPKYDLTSHLIVNLTNPKSKVNVVYFTQPYYTYLTTQLWSSLSEEATHDQFTTKDWTFLEGYNRVEESEYIEAILDGDIKATSKVGSEMQRMYFRLQSVRGTDVMFINTIEERRKALNALYDKLESKGMEVRGLNDFAVYCSPLLEKKESSSKFISITELPDKKNELKSHRRKRVKHKVRILTGYYVFDSDNKEYLPDINRVLGYSGEFSREPQYENQLPYHLVNNENEYEYFYRVEEDASIYLTDLKSYSYEGNNSSIISTLRETDKLSTNINNIQRIETAPDTTQVEKYWYETERYRNGRFENDNTSQHQV